MGAEDGDFAAGWKQALNGRALLGGALDMIFPREDLNGEPTVGVLGLSAEAWMRIHFLDGPVCDGCGDSQGGKSGAHRRRNVAGAFVVPERRRALVEGRRILLIDDVLTTGATAEGCARALKQAGAARVDLAVIARVKEADGLTI